MPLVVRLAILVAALLPLAAWGDASPRVTLATPGVGSGAIERFTLRFSAAMVPLGDPHAEPPADSPCSGEGRWVDQSTWVYAFAEPLAGGTTCDFQLRSELKSVAGYAIAGTTRFKVDAGGPVARAVLAGTDGSEIEEDQVFLVAANMPAIRASIAANAYCAVDGIGEKIPVDVLAADLPGKLLGELGTEQWQVRSFLDSAGLPDTLPANVQDRARALASVVALKCRRPLPPGRDMALVWGAGVAGAGGKTAGTDQRYDFTVRKPFTARWECSRVNPQAGCNPVKDAWVRFSAPIPRAQAEAVRLTFADGSSRVPVFGDDDKNKAAIADLKFAGPLPEATTAQLTLPADVKDESGRPLSNAERFPLAVKIDQAPPLVKFAAVFGILEAQEGGVLPVTVRAVEPSLAGRTGAVVGQSLRVDASDSEIAAWLRRLDEHEESDFEEVKRGAETITINNTASKPLLAPGQGAAMQVGLPGKGKEFEVVGVPLTKLGFYVVELASPALGRALLGRNAPRYVAAGALVTNMSVHFKWGREGSLAWVTSLDSGKPVGAAEVRISDSCTGQVIARGQTDAQGRLLVRKELPEPEAYGSCEGEATNHPLMVSARKAGDFAFDLTSWNEGIRPYDFDLPYGWEAKKEIVHTVFDRALVRQGETIHMKHIVRVPNGSGFGMGGPFTGTLKLRHRGSDTEFELPLSIDANGTGENEWLAPQGAPMGDYDLQMVLDGGEEPRTIYTDQSFKLDEYRLPTMRASVTGPKEAQVRPKSLPLDLYVGYLSGGGASNLPVDLRVGYFAATKAPENYDAFTFGGMAVEVGVKPMNGDGEDEETPLPPTQSLPVTLTGDGTGHASIDVPQLTGMTDMLVEMDYEDANGEILTASRRIPLFTSGVQLGLRTDGWLMKQDDVRLKLVALDVNGRPIKGQKVSVELYSREILTARRRLIGGFYAYDNRMKTTKLSGSCSGTTDAQGFADCALDPGVSGEVYAVATTTDANGNIARAVKSVWLVGDDDWWFGGDNGDRMDLIPEAPEYTAGANARFQVRMPFRDATALVTVEREGVLSSFVTDLSGKNPVVEVPMPGAYAPDVFVSVLAVRGRVGGGWWSWLGDTFRSWGLDWFSRESARPTATVDLAKPSYRLGIAKVKVGWEAHRLGVAVKADRERYAARDTAQVDLAVKTPDGKPAAFADVAFVAVDEALLQLAPNDSWDVLTAMMGERQLSVLTSTAQMQVVGKRHYGRKTAEPGGGGGGDLSGLNRENFEPVLLWRGRVPLDRQGHARVAVPLSDALTSFKLVAIATDGSQAFGTGEASVRTAQDLQSFAGLPPLVRTGDWYAAGFTLRNGSAKPMTVTAEVAVEPVIARGKPMTVTIPAGGAVPIAWNLLAPPQPGTLRWTLTARSADGKANDRVTVTQQVAPAVPIETWAAVLTRVSPAGTTIPITPPAGALPGFGSVDVALTDTLAPPLDGVRRYMGNYPYGCFEQRLSKAVALGDTGAWTALAGEMPTYLDGDGLLRYFPGDYPGSEALTAYVLSLTAEAGLPVPEGPKARMVEALKAVIDGRLRHEDYGDVRLRKLAAFAALARQGAATSGMLGQLGIAPQEMPTASLADYIVALGKVPGLANGAALRAQAEGVLRSRLVYEGTRLDLSDAANASWWLMSSADEASIKAVLATLGRPGWQDDAPRMMAGVAMRQRRGHWDTTTANAWGTVAARRFGSLYPAEAIAGITTGTLGTRVVSRSWPLLVPQRSLSWPLPAAATPLRLAQAGGAGPWALVSVRAAVPLTKPLAAGYRLTKQVEVVQARKAGTLTRGDVVRVTLTVEASAERNWVVVSDPVPAGATVIGGMANQSAMLDQGAEGTTSPSYVERGNDAWRGYFAWLPRGTHKVSYTMRLNGVGRLQLPPTRVEAMYSPSIFAAVPNQPVVVEQR